MLPRLDECVEQFLRDGLGPFDGELRGIAHNVPGRVLTAHVGVAHVVVGIEMAAHQLVQEIDGGEIAPTVRNTGKLSQGIGHSNIVWLTVEPVLHLLFRRSGSHKQTRIYRAEYLG